MARKQVDLEARMAALELIARGPALPEDVSIDQALDYVGIMGMGENRRPVYMPPDDWGEVQQADPATEGEGGEGGEPTEGEQTSAESEPTSEENNKEEPEGGQQTDPKVQSRMDAVAALQSMSQGGKATGSPGNVKPDITKMTAEEFETHYTELARKAGV